jgi:hypothetical protein
MGRRLALGLAAAGLAVAGLAALALRGGSEAPAIRAGGARGEGPALGAPLAAAGFYRIDEGPRTPCVAGAPCEARLVLTALAGFKVNREYPFKFVADPVAGVAVDGTGAFALEDARVGTLVLRFRAARPGLARFAGTFKLSVCTDEQCEIEQPRLAFALPVTAPGD